MILTAEQRRRRVEISDHGYQQTHSVQTDSVRSYATEKKENCLVNMT